MVSQRSKMKPWLTVVGLVVIFLGITFSFLTNGFGVASWNEWSTWERGSEAMVMKRIEVDLVQKDSPNLGLAAYMGDEFTVYDRLSAEGLPDLETSAPADFVPYESEIGGQAHFWSFLWRELGCSSISCLHAVSSAFSAGAVIAMFLALSLIGSKSLGWAWLIAVAFSPWITYAARNLFWSPWLYFLPALAATGLVMAKSRRWRWVALGGVFISFLVKYLATGYHEFTAFTMLAASMPIIAIVFHSRYSRNIRKQWFNVALILISSIVAMATVLCLHAYFLTGNVISGLQQIWRNTVVRRTHGGLGESDPVYADSLDASVIEVIWKYIWKDWSTDLLSFSIDKSGSVFTVSLGSVSFAVLIFVSTAIVLRRFWSGDSLWVRDATLLALGFCIPIIWFIAGKGYSYIHTFILFFLWYFLFVPALLFVVGSFLWGYRYLMFTRGKTSSNSEARLDGVSMSGAEANG